MATYKRPHQMSLAQKEWLAHFRTEGFLTAFLDKTKEPWEEFLFPGPG